LTHAALCATRHSCQADPQVTPVASAARHQSPPLGYSREPVVIGCQLSCLGRSILRSRDRAVRPKATTVVVIRSYFPPRKFLRAKTFASCGRVSGPVFLVKRGSGLWKRISCAAFVMSTKTAGKACCGALSIWCRKDCAASGKPPPYAPGLLTTAPKLPRIKRKFFFFSRFFLFAGFRICRAAPLQGSPAKMHADVSGAAGDA